MCPAGRRSARTARSSTPHCRSTPEPWDRADVVYVASLVGGIFGKGGGAEFANARWLQQLEAQFGPEEARRIFDDLALADDPQAPTTSSDPAPYAGAPGRPDAARRRPPDLDGRHGAGHGGRRRLRRGAGPGDGVPGGAARRGPADGRRRARSARSTSAPCPTG